MDLLQGSFARRRRACEENPAEASGGQWVKGVSDRAEGLKVDKLVALVVLVALRR